MQDRNHVCAFQAWDYKGFEALYEKYVDTIFAFVYRRTSHRELAEDITSQVWIKVLKSLEFFWEKDNANFKSWVYRIAQNTVIDHYRCRKEKIDIDAIAHPWISEDFATNIDNKNKLRDVLEYMKKLKPIEREVLTLRIWDDLSYKHIASIVGKKENTCKKIFSRSLKKVTANISMLLLLLVMIF